MIIKEGDVVTLKGHGNKKYKVLAMTDEGEMILEHYLYGKYSRKLVSHVSFVKEIKGFK